MDENPYDGDTIHPEKKKNHRNFKKVQTQKSFGPFFCVLVTLDYEISGENILHVKIRSLLRHSRIFEVWQSFFFKWKSEFGFTKS